MSKLRGFLREVEWYGVIAVVLVALAVGLVVFTTLWELPVILGFAAVVSAIFSLKN